MSPAVKVTAQALWEANRDLADACLAHPLVQGIASGELSLARFQVYVAQDACFLEAFARAYALALAKSTVWKDVVLFKDLLAAVFDELQLHEGYARRWGASLDAEPLPATSAYVDFLLRTASLEPVGHTAAAMAPCTCLYAFLGQQLLPTLNPDSPYREWVETYSAPEVTSLIARLDELIDRHAGESERLAHLYRRAMQLELAFFESAWKAA